MFMATTKSYPNLHIQQPDNRANMLENMTNLAFHSDRYDQWL